MYLYIIKQKKENMEKFKLKVVEIETCRGVRPVETTYHEVEGENEEEAIKKYVSDMMEAEEVMDEGEIEMYEGEGGGVFKILDGLYVACIWPETEYIVEFEHADHSLTIYQIQEKMEEEEYTLSECAQWLQ